MVGRTATAAVLDSIDHTLSDVAVSPDAVRSIPDSGALVLRIGEKGAVTEVPMRLGHTGSDLRAALGCTRIDRISLDPYFDMWIDDEGAGDKNPLATVLLTKIYGPAVSAVFGATVITRVAGRATAPLTPADHGRLRFLLATLEREELLPPDDEDW